MFTGLIETIGAVTVVTAGPGDGRRLTISAAWAEELERGESVAVDGACLTVVECGPAGFDVEATGETVARTILGDYVAGRRVHLERALAVGGRLGGHFVQGHIDTVATVQRMERDGENRYIHLAVPDVGRPLVASQGSLAVNGVSLTVLALTPEGVHLMIIPHTWAATTMADWAAGERVNVEYDLIARYIHRIMEMRE